MPLIVNKHMQKCKNEKAAGVPEGGKTRLELNQLRLKRPCCRAFLLQLSCC